ncbi:hypothetical protein CLV92_11396 [Kineococcus xinjiangensis]|uniref:Uncharacterized protein n=1 Tax=Kineococcus xinjiangensis TaxID=512762 RepID=A0A2S6IEP4_9ACTN|nr:hypothetical protein [Kineococcus xinjiangensis]PPK92667.1 hypothetical protein CLV92_11396 [Kineococcus xinjiangensis]
MSAHRTGPEAAVDEGNRPAAAVVARVGDLDVHDDHRAKNGRIVEVDGADISRWDQR